VLLKLGLLYGPKTETTPPAEEETTPSTTEESPSPRHEAVRQLELSEVKLAESESPDTATARKSAPKEVGEAVAYWLTQYGRKPSEASRAIRELAAKSPERVLEKMLEIFVENRGAEATPFLARFLSSEGQVAEKLCDPSASLEHSVSVARSLSRHEPRFDVRFAKSLLDDDQMADSARQRGLVQARHSRGNGPARSGDFEGNTGKESGLARHRSKAEEGRSRGPWLELDSVPTRRWRALSSPDREVITCATSQP